MDEKNIPIEEQSLPFESTMTEDEIKYEIASKVFAKLNHWQLDPSEMIVRRILEKMWKAKEPLRIIFRRHPNWNERQQAIIFEDSFNASANREDIAKFARWCRDNLLKADYFSKKVVDLSSFDSCYQRDRALSKKEEELGEFLYHVRGYSYMTLQNREEWSKINNFFGDGNVFNSSVVDNDFIEEVEALNVPEIVPPIGQKLSRAVRKICAYYGLDKIVDMQKVVHNGVEQQKDIGWNYNFAMFGDAINPVSIKRFTALSINFMDYITMSNGTNWYSCHFPDVNMIDSSRHDGDTYDYCHASGTLSYALDGATAIFYTVSPDYKGDMCDAQKERRMNFHFAEDGKSFVFGRLYPDGRDGGETGLAAVFRRTVQKILAECLGENNLWVVKRGDNEDYVHSIGTHYEDFFYYSDTGHSYLKETEMPKINIGRHPICPCCGEEHYESGDLRCEDCSSKDRDDEYCYECENGINTDRDVYFYCEEDNRYFCSESCYQRAGYVMCEDGEIHHNDNCQYDNYDENYYYADWEDGVSPDGDSWYSCRSHCEMDGWVELYHDGSFDWYREDDIEEDAYTGEIICSEWGEIFTPNDGDTYYLNIENAIKDGWHPSEDDISRLKEEGIDCEEEDFIKLTEQGELNWEKAC